MKKLSFLIATALCIMACSGGSDEQPDGPGNGNGKLDFLFYVFNSLPTNSLRSFQKDVRRRWSR